MSSHDQHADQRSELRNDFTQKITEAVISEISAGKQGLVNGIRRVIDHLKAGGRSGITGEFGKPQLFDSANAAGHNSDAHSNHRGQSSSDTTRSESSCRSDASVESNQVPNSRQGDVPPETTQAPNLRHGEIPVETTQAPTQRRDAADEAPDLQGEGQIARGFVEPQYSGGDGPASPHRNRHDEHGARGERSRPGDPHRVIRMPAEQVRVSTDTTYRGEYITRDVNPSEHTVHSGDTTQSVARAHLGSGATDAQVQSHAREIERVNHLRNTEPLREGQVLTLPGHTLDGGYVTKDSAGALHTRWQEGSERVEGSNGTGYVRHPAADGGYTQHNWGRLPENNYDVTRTADGHYLIADRPGDVPRESTTPNDQRVEHARLNDLAESRISNPDDLAQFRSNMAQFEQRAHDQHLPPEEVARTYQQIERLLEHSGRSPVPENRRIELAQQVMEQAANPTTIDQGYHSTCNVAAVESRLYTRNPSEAARMVTEVATTGQFTTRDGTVVTPPANSIRPDSEAAVHPPDYNARSYASQIFQVTAVNMHYQSNPYVYTDARGHQHTVPAGGMRYEQRAHVAPPDTGERLIDTTRRPPRVVERTPELSEDQIARINNRLTGESGHDMIIGHRDTLSGDVNGSTAITSEQELNDRIAQAARDGKLPVIVRVEAGNQPWFHDSGGGTAGGSDGAHVVCVTGYEEGPPARVQVDNQWGEQSDHLGSRSMSVHDLYQSMRVPDNSDQLAQLQRDVDYDRTHNSIDTRKEFELLRLRHNLPSDDPNYLNEADYNRLVNEQIHQSGMRWAQQRKDGHLNQSEYDNGRRELGDIARSQSFDRRLDIIERCHTSGVVNDSEYDASITNAIRDSRRKWAEEDHNGTGDRGERRRTRAALDRMLNALPADRRQTIIANSRE